MIYLIKKLEITCVIKKINISIITFKVKFERSLYSKKEL